MYTIVIHLHTQKQALSPSRLSGIKMKKTHVEEQRDRESKKQRENGKTEKQRKRKKEGEKKAVPETGNKNNTIKKGKEKGKM